MDEQIIEEGKYPVLVHFAMDEIGMLRALKEITGIKSRVEIIREAVVEYYNSHAVPEPTK